MLQNGVGFWAGRSGLATLVACFLVILWMYSARCPPSTLGLTRSAVSPDAINQLF